MVRRTRRLDRAVGWSIPLVVSFAGCGASDVSRGPARDAPGAQPACSQRTAPRSSAPDEADVWTGWNWGHIFPAEHLEAADCPSGLQCYSWTPSKSQVLQVEARIHQAVSAQLSGPKCLEQWARQYVGAADGSGSQFLWVVLTDPWVIDFSPEVVHEGVSAYWDCRRCSISVLYNVATGHYVVTWDY